MSKRKKRAFKDGIYKITFSPGTPSEAVMTVAIGLFLREIGLSKAPRVPRVRVGRDPGRGPAHPAHPGRGGLRPRGGG